LAMGVASHPHVAQWDPEFFFLFIYIYIYIYIKKKSLK
jgi:hypothetical protein